MTGVIVTSLAMLPLHSGFLIIRLEKLINRRAMQVCMCTPAWISLSGTSSCVIYVAVPLDPE